MQSKMVGLLTMSRRAGKLLLGFDAVKEGLKQRQVVQVMLAMDCAPKTEKEIRYFAGEIPVNRLPMDMDTLAQYFRKRTAVMGLTDAGFAKKLMDELEPAGGEIATTKQCGEVPQDNQV